MVVHGINFGSLRVVTIGHAEILGWEINARQIKRRIKQKNFPLLIHVIEECNNMSNGLLYLWYLLQKVSLTFFI
jgi:hypothetical protein